MMYRDAWTARYPIMAVLLAVAVVAGVAVGGGFTPAKYARGVVRYTAPERRLRLDLDSGWRFHLGDVAAAQVPSFDDRGWSPVDTPHTWNAVDGADGGDNYHRGVGWYRQHRKVPEADRGKRLVLDFGAANQIADVWANGVYLGRHQGGYAEFRFDATAALRVGADNVLAVRVDNSYNADIPPLGADYTLQGGLYRDVTLWAVDPVGISMFDNAGPGVYLRQHGVSAASATVDVTTRLTDATAQDRPVVVRATLTDDEGKTVTARTGAPTTVRAQGGADDHETLVVDYPHRWDGVHDPYLYHVTVEVRDASSDAVLDAVTQPLGLRTISVDPDEGFFLNGHHLPLHGVALHQDRGGVGWAETSADRVQDFGLIRQIGANAVRMVHYQHDQEDYTLADQQGLVVWAELPLVSTITDSAAFTANAEQQLRELIVQNYNHPSIVFWSIGNEQAHDDRPTNALLTALAVMVRHLDPDRLSTYANCCVSDISAVVNHTDVSAYNRYYGWYYGTVDRFGPWADSLHFANPSRDIGISEYGAGADPAQHSADLTPPSPIGAVHPEEYQAYYHERMWKQIVARPYIWGTFVWNMFDFASDSRAEGGAPGINDKGLVTRDRKIKKDAFYWYAANWSSAPVLYITSRRWTTRTAAGTQLKVYSNASTVTASLDGQPLGSRGSGDHIFLWNQVTLRPGANTVTVTAVVNGIPLTDTATWTLM
jgi:beta-galactosidase